MSYDDQWPPAAETAKAEPPSPATVEECTTPPITYGDQNSPPRRQCRPPNNGGHYERPARRRSHRSITDVPEARPIRTRIPRADRHRRKVPYADPARVGPVGPHPRLSLRRIEAHRPACRTRSADRRRAEIVKPGFGNQYGRTCAPIYRLRHWWITTPGWRNPTRVDTDTQMSRSNKVDERQIRKWMTTNRVVDHDTQVSYLRPITVLLTGRGHLSRVRHQTSRNRQQTPHPKTFNRTTKHADPEPPRHCPRHMPDGTDDNCGACGIARRQLRRLEEKNRRTGSPHYSTPSLDHRRLRRLRRLRAPYSGGVTHCPNHPNFRQLSTTNRKEPT